LYKSGNPFKRPCPLTTMTSTRAELEAQQAKWAAHGSQKPPKLKGSGSGGKATAAEAAAHRKLIKGMEEERQLAEALAGRIPEIEKEEAVRSTLVNSLLMM
jgi:hypothetical protein